VLPQGIGTLLRRSFRLAWHGIHGAPHWARVMRHGIHIAGQTGGDVQVVRLFALLHDSQRRDEGRDPEHGPRAADFVMRLHRDGLLGLDDSRAACLAMACEGHSRGGMEDHPTIAACWDADRLDLGRIGIRPDPRRLITAAAAAPRRIELAWSWARGGRP
jgi:uncharacterized protein